MVFCPCLPGLLQKHPRIDGASKRPMMEECLPLDALEAIMGFLDREALCTARLVSKTFCAAASAHVCSLTLASTTKAVSFHRYPHLRNVNLTHAYPRFLDKEAESLAELDPCLRDVATALTVSFGPYGASIAQTRDYLSQAPLLPKLRKLEVKGGMMHEALLLARCTNLEAIRIRWSSTSVARTIVTITRLTLLDIGSVRRDDDQEGFVDHSWLEHATNLRSLHSLRICIVNGALPLIGNLTGLTELAILDYPDTADSIAPLTRLTRLRSLHIHWWEMTESNLGIACSLGSGSLVDLELWGRKEASADCGRFLSCQTALRRLNLHGQQLCNLRYIGGVRIELLQCLKVHDIGVLDAEGTSVLWRATSLTRLTIGGGITQPQMGLSQVLARLTQLRSLSLKWFRKGDDDPNILDLPLALSPLTALTKLKMNWHRLDDGDLGALLVLTGLRVLKLVHCRLTDDVLPELGVLTRLSSLTIRQGIMNLAPVSEALDPLRNARGLLPLHTSLW